MSFAISVAAALAVAAGLARMLLREQRFLSELRSIQERMRELAARVEATEGDVAHAVTQAEISENLLVEKGIADEEDIEAARRKYDGAAATSASSSRYIPGRDGGLH